MIGLGQSHELTVKMNGILEIKGSVRMAIFNKA